MKRCENSGCLRKECITLLAGGPCNTSAPTHEIGQVTPSLCDTPAPFVHHGFEYRQILVYFYSSVVEASILQSTFQDVFFFVVEHASAGASVVYSDEHASGRLGKLKRSPSP